MLVLSPGFVGGFLLPVLGAVPDGMIVLFSGLGDNAQEQLSVGVGALAGSTIMLLTLPWVVCAIVGRVDLSPDGRRALFKRGLTKEMGGRSWRSFFMHSGIQTSDLVNPGARIMMLTSLTYLVIQGPAFALSGTYGRTDTKSLGRDESSYALAGFLLAFLSFVGYSYYCVRSSSSEERQLKVISDARSSLLSSGAVKILDILRLEHGMGEKGVGRCAIRALFNKYDADKNGELDTQEVRAMMVELGLPLSPPDLKALMLKSGGKDQLIQFDEFEVIINETCQTLDSQKEAHKRKQGGINYAATGESGTELLIQDEDDGEEGDSDDEEGGEDTEENEGNLSKTQIYLRSAGYLSVGILVILIFSDPMVDVLSAIAKKAEVPAFYISFIFAPMISNASEIISSISQAMKKKKSNLDVTYGQLLGAATMNVSGAPTPREFTVSRFFRPYHISR